jgi:hypothetical protein
MNTQVLNFKKQIVLLACMFALCSCEAIKDKINVDVPFDSFSIKLDDIVIGGGDAKSAIVRFDEEDELEPLTPFRESQVVSMDKMPDLPADIIVKRDQVKSFKAAKVTVIVTSTDENATVVEPFKMEATGISDPLEITKYELGTAHVLNGDEKGFVDELVQKVIVEGNEVSITISGKTDVADAETLTVTIIIEDGEFKLNAIK